MYLQSLELFGFKSFAPKTKLEFHRGVTAVVGPNGCGKSNVLDAMRWVLGEQSAKALRGGEMADVIFSGTDSRAAVGMAEVSMTFSECEEQLGLDWHEVTITRRVFKDGGSEYLLNKTPCRLKDIQQLFMDTGIGRTAYSIMEQGKIDMILSSRPEDRRAIFEEAAGITKYKSQKKEALRKLEATEANLLRLSDIIKEVKRQIGSLQRQAGKARRYQSLISDLKMLETHSAKRQFDLFAEQQESTAAELARLADQQIECEQEIEARESEIAVQRAALDEMEQRLNSARQGVGDLKTRISNHENRIIFNEERALEFTELVERYQADVAGGEEKFRIAETQLRDTDTELEQITSLLATELRVMEEKQAATAALTAQRQEAERTIAAATNDSARIESRVSGLRGQVSSVSQQRDGAEARLSVLSGELDQLTFAFAQFTDKLRDTQAELDRTLTDAEMRAAQVGEAETQLREAQVALTGIDRELRDTQRALAERESKVEVLRHLIEAGEGLSEGTQAVLRGLDNPDFFKPAVAGALAQLIEVEPQHVRAVEAALNGHLQAVVMKDAMIAEAMIKTLTTQQLGRATLALRELLPLADFRRAENRRPACSRCGRWSAAARISLRCSMRFWPIPIWFIPWSRPSSCAAPTRSPLSRPAANWSPRRACSSAASPAALPTPSSTGRTRCTRWKSKPRRFASASRTPRTPGRRSSRKSKPRNSTSMKRAKKSRTSPCKFRPCAVNWRWLSARLATPNGNSKTSKASAPAARRAIAKPPTGCRGSRPRSPSSFSNSKSCSPAGPKPLTNSKSCVPARANLPASSTSCG